MTFSSHPSVNRLYNFLHEKFPYLSGVVKKQHVAYGNEWLDLFEREIKTFFGSDNDRLERAVFGYGKFCLDSMKLQVLFQKTKEYENKTYAQAAQEVYQNREYMFGLYLPGILLSHYLWSHHYAQHIFYTEKFLPLVGTGKGKVFYDIGVGTGFYSKEMLKASELTGQGFDLSPHSMEHTMGMLKAHGVSDRYTPNLRDIIKQPVANPADYIVNIEVLEHLEDPQAFLNALSNMLKPGGHGLISAAINAPNADHIYLYRNEHEVAAQLKAAGFTIVDYTVDRAYEPRKSDDLVPVNVAFIVTK